MKIAAMTLNASKPARMANAECMRVVFKPLFVKIGFLIEVKFLLEISLGVACRRPATQFDALTQGLASAANEAAKCR